MWGWMSGWSWLFMVLTVVGFWALVIAGVIVAVRLLGGRGDDADRRRNGQHALEILKERFTRGEIDEEEYRRRCTALTDVPHGTAPRPAGRSPS